jgi:LPS export ABC transporter protein LptC/lipopolysaccharide transport protein LptA
VLPLLKNHTPFFFGALWTIVILLFPLTTNNPEQSLVKPQKSTGEILFKSQLTHANFGLLKFRFYESKKGLKNLQVLSEFAELHRTKNYAFLKEVTASVFSQGSKNTIETKSDYGRCYLDEDWIDLEGNVRIRSQLGYLFNLERLEYNSKMDLFSSEERVRMRGPNIDSPEMFLTGIGLKGESRTEHFFIKKNVQAIRRLNRSDWMRIESQSGEFFTTEQRAKFTGKVNSTLPQILLKSDTLELSIGGRAEVIVANGNVVLRNNDRVGNADSAQILLETDEIILEGNAHVKTSDNEIQGKRILLHTDNDHVEVQGASGSILK